MIVEIGENNRISKCGKAISAALAVGIVVVTQGSAGAQQPGSDCPAAPARMNVIISDAAEIFGTQGDDFICAGPGNNVISARGGDDIIYGNDGNDLIFGRAGNDTIYGGNGNDNLRGSSGDDAVFGGSGSDRMRGGTGKDTLSGQDGRDRIDGGFDRDLIDGGSGNDVLQGRRGRDIMTGGAGNDFVRGGVGSDIVAGGRGNDRLHGGFGNDTILGEAGDDRIHGEDGSDEIEGGPGLDRSDGGADADDCNSSEWYVLCELGGEDLIDADGDRVGDVFDNCPNDVNPFQTDSDRDDIGEMCDPDTKIVASDVTADDAFGTAVAFSGETIVVGAPGDSDTASSAGAAYVFAPDGKGGLDETKLVASDGDSEDLFGSTVALSGDTIVVGATGDEANGEGSGSVYVFTPDGNGGFEETKLTASDGATGDGFSSAISADLDTIVVGASLDDSLTGGVYVYTPNGNGGFEETKLVASDGATGDLFGSGVAIDGTTIAVTAVGDELLTGAVYVYTPDGAGGFEEVKLTPSDGIPSGRFGVSVAVDGDAIVVGAYPVENGGVTLGSVYVFTPDGLGGYIEEKLPKGDNSSLDRYGTALDASGGNIVVGAHLADLAVNDSGSIHFFGPDGIGGRDVVEFAAPDADVNQAFGFAVAMEGDTVVSGAPADDENAGNGGAVYRLIPARN